MVQKKKKNPTEPEDLLTSEDIFVYFYTETFHGHIHGNFNTLAYTHFVDIFPTVKIKFEICMLI